MHNVLRLSIVTVTFLWTLIKQNILDRKFIPEGIIINFPKISVIMILEGFSSVIEFAMFGNKPVDVVNAPSVVSFKNRVKKVDLDRFLTVK